MLTLSLLAYAAVLFTVHVPWGQVALRTFWPNVTLNSDAATVVVGVFGTTISPYLFFWRASKEVEDLCGVRPLLQDPGSAIRELRRIRWDGIVMSGRRPLIKGYFGVALIVGAVMSSAFFCGE